MMGNVARREFVQGVGLVVGALAATAGYPPALAQLTTNVGSKPMTYEIKPLAFDPKSNPPLCNLYVSMLQRLGLEVNKFGSSTGTLTGLEFRS